MHSIYLVRKDSKPVYVGYTSKSVEGRWKEHIRYTNQEKKPKYPLHHAIKKHGVDSFTIETLYESDDGEHTLNFMEHHYIWLYRTYKSLGGYNLTIGGGGWSNGRTDKERMERHKVSCKAYREANKDKRKAVNKAWYERNRDKRKAYRKANKDKRKAYLEANKDNIKIKKKAYDKAYREANKDKIKAAKKIYREAKKGSVDFSTDPGSEVPCAG